MEVPFRTINAATVASPMQLINELSVEYNCTPPNYEVTSINLNSIPTFIANCTVIKDCIRYSCTSEQSSSKKHAKHDAARKVLELLNKSYVFSEQNGLEAIPRNLGGRKVLYKWNGACEKCYERGHLIYVCKGPTRNKITVKRSKQNINFNIF